jgi:hypothetical protein
MKILSIYKKLLPLILLFPMASFGNNLNKEVSDTETLDSESIFKLNPSETLVLNFSSSQLIINHQIIQDAIGDNFQINKEQPLGIRFHEESNTLDFSTIDGISHTVSIEKVSGTPPNGV